MGRMKTFGLKCQLQVCFFILYIMVALLVISILIQRACLLKQRIAPSSMTAFGPVGPVTHQKREEVFIANMLANYFYE